MEIKIKKLNDTAKIPEYAKEGDAGLDLFAVSKKMDGVGFIEYGTGIALEIPEGFVGLIFPRSSISRANLQLCNSVGVIDSGYRGEIKCRFKPSTVGKGIYELGDKIAQIIILPYPKIILKEVLELSATDRGDGSFGSTGV